MAEPARNTPRWTSGEPDPEPDDTLSSDSVLQRWVERPDGPMELIELPLTPELFLDPQLEDSMVQGGLHAFVRRNLADLLYRAMRHDETALVLEDVKHLLGSGLPGPAPDVSVIRGLRNAKDDRRSYDLVKEGVPPCLIIEIVSHYDARLRRTDEVDKVALYQRVGVPDYLLVEMPRRANGHRFHLKGYRLGPDGRYQPIEPDAEGRLLSETTGLRFGVSPEGDRLEVFDARTGERWLTSVEEEEGRKSEAAAREAEVAARKAAEEEVARFRAELDRLKKSGAKLIQPGLDT